MHIIVTTRGGIPLTVEAGGLKHKSSPCFESVPEPKFWLHRIEKRTELEKFIAKWAESGY